MPKSLRILTWNINSVRLRQGLLKDVVDKLSPDVVCLQETKCPDELFPQDLSQVLGFKHVLFRGMKGYNGVAVFSKLPMRQHVDTQDWVGKQDCRHLAVEIDAPGGPIIVHNFYVPAGGDIPDTEVNPKFAHKLDFVAAARDHFAKTPKLTRSVLVGDLNIAPLEHDVWSHKQLLKIVSHTPVETALLTEWQETCWHDGLRHFVPADQKLYTWWSYRAKDWEAANKGRRLDHVWVTHDLKGALKRHEILKEARGWTQASDHVPVLVELAL
ncbi:exodeoxyribonuclease III [Acidisoma cellulosilytica]|uniref:Exodeoxyribonuclease III n=1 Tax=Acidisoma cellulosilyticum TaxID=2802395 RepID=A0A964E271_9PROT|nr:exodeoxyribonuclease III [Acidisoma cellulosilyticum]MCB8878942.1 exodeoxyribonuclease III [Acidisoma cellulosilyticum]